MNGTVTIIRVPIQDWPTINRFRGRLIDKDIVGTLTAEETTCLAALQAYADYYIEATTPRQFVK